jgi:hypothetical protein
VEQAGVAAPVAEQDQVLAERTDFKRYVAGIGHKTDRVPIAAEQFTHSRTASDRGQFGPGDGRSHGIGGAEIAIPLGDVHPLPPAGLCAVFVENENRSQSEREIDDYVNGFKNLGIR